MKIKITMEIAPELADPGHPMGVTEAGYEALADVLGDFGHAIEIMKEEEEAE